MLEQSSPASVQQAITFLSRAPLRNIVLLKMLHAYPEAIRCYFAAEGSEAGVLLLLPTQASSFDRQAYPATEYVVLLTATGPEVGQRLLPHLPVGCNLVFKFMDRADRAVVETRFSLRRVTAFLSYTSRPASRFSPWPEVDISDRPEAACLALFETQGYEPEVVRRACAGGHGEAVALRRNGDPLSVCFTFCNFGEVWEIGGVYTRPDERRRGHARKVVETALHTLLQQRRIPRYQVHEENRASISLAEALGLELFVSMEHYAGNW
jgi:GNAT superfamily N-acetyltransferase